MFIHISKAPCLSNKTRDSNKVGGGGGHVARLILKRLVSVFMNACRLLSVLPSLSQFGRGRLSLVTISFYAKLLVGIYPGRASRARPAGRIGDFGNFSIVFTKSP